MVVSESHKTSPAAGLLDRYQADPQASARVLLVTIFGDVVRPRGQPVSVQSLARLVAPFGVNERLVRTSLLRLSRDGMVSNERRGRQSFYSVSGESVETFRRADHRIYNRPLDEWDGRWTIAIVGGAETDDGEQRSQLRRELAWLGLTAVAADTFVSPIVLPSEVSALALRLDVPMLAIARAELADEATVGDVALAAIVTPVDDLRADYLIYIKSFAAVAAALPSATLDPADSFVIRTLLIDGWRRLVLRDRGLPDALLPSDWPAAEAYELTARLYRAVLAASERHVDELAGPAAGAWPDLERRFASTT